MAAAAAAMEPHDRRLSVKPSGRIAKSSSSAAAAAPRAAPSSISSSSSRPPSTVVSADLANFRRVVQQLTGSPPPSAASSPLRDPPSSSRSSRLHRLAPRPLRDSFRLQQNLLQQNLQQPTVQRHHRPPYHRQLDPPPLHLQQQNHKHHHACSINGDPEGGTTHQQYNPDHFSWLKTAGIISPLFPHPQPAADPHRPSESSRPPPYPPPIPSPQSPQLIFSALPPLTPTDSLWAYTTASPRPFSNSAAPFSPLLPLPSERARDPGSGSGHGVRNEASEGSGLSRQSGDGYGVLHLPSNAPPLLPSPSQGHLLLPSSSTENPPPFSSANQNAQLGPSPTGSLPLFPTSPASSFPQLALPFSPSTASCNPWLYSWPPSPFMPLPFSPGLFPPSPGLGSLVSSPRGYLFDYPPKLP